MGEEAADTATSWVDDARDAINKGHRERRKDKAKEYVDNLDPESRVGLEAIVGSAGVPREDPAEPNKEEINAEARVATAAGEDLATGEPGDKGSTDGEPGGEAEPYDPVAALASGASTVRLMVDGEEQEVSAADVLRLGVQTSQKEHSIGQRFTELKGYEGRLDGNRRELLQQEQNLRNGLALDGSPIPGKETNSGKGLPDGAPEAEIDNKLFEDFNQAVFSADRPKISEALKAIVQTGAAQGRFATPRPVEEIVERVSGPLKAAIRADLAQEQRDEEMNRINSVFSVRFPEIDGVDDSGNQVGDPILFSAAQTQFEALGKDPLWAHRSGVDRAVEAGERIMKRLSGGAPVQESAGSELDSRRATKAALPPLRVPGGRRQPKPAEKPMTRSEYIASLRRARGIMGK